MDHGSNIIKETTESGHEWTWGNDVTFFCPQKAVNLDLYLSLTFACSTSEQENKDIAFSIKYTQI